jgi:hypothetical protein
MAEEVIYNVKSRWLATFGLPSIFRSDNGLEFKNPNFVNEIMSWDGECKIVYGRPRHPQSQGLVEQANGIVEKMIAAGIKQFKTKEWSKLLPTIQYS